jgi:hypothetical protein
MSRHGYSGEDALAGSLIGIAIVVLVFLLYLLIKACNLIFRVLAKYPKNKVLWLMLFLFIGLTILTVLTRGYPVFATLTAFSFLALTATARIVQLYYNEFFIQEVPLVTGVLRRPWWQGTNTQLAAA